MSKSDHILETIERLKGSGKTFAEFLAEVFKDKFLEIYVGDSYEDVSIDQISVTYPSVFCGKVFAAYRECLILNCVYVSDEKHLKLGNLVFINERAIRALTEVDNHGVIEDMMLRSRETLEVANIGRQKVKTTNILEKTAIFEEQCLQALAVIKKLPNGKYQVQSEKGRNMGTYTSKEKAKKRLQTIEMFKHMDKNHADDNAIDLTDIDEFAYSAIMRKLNQNASKEQVSDFIKIFKTQFDAAIKKKIHNPEKIALQNTVIKFNKLYPIKINTKLIKSAAITELGNANAVGKYLSDIVKFILNRIPNEKRAHAQEILKQKFLTLSESQIASKELPQAAAYGQAITFVKHVLFNHDANYIREVLNSLASNL